MNVAVHRMPCHGRAVLFVLVVPWLPLSAAAPASAQGGWSIEPSVTYTWHSDLFSHDVSAVSPVDGSRRDAVEELRLEAAPGYRIDLQRRTDSGWIGGIEAGYSTSTYRYRQESRVDGAVVEQEAQAGDSRSWTVGLTVGRQLALQPRTSVRLRLGGWFRRHDLEVSCVPTGGFPCQPPEWDRFDVPGAGLRAGLEHGITPRLAVRLDGTAMIGRSDTSAFWTDLMPELDHQEAPKRQTVYTGQLGFGAVLRLQPP